MQGAAGEERPRKRGRIASETSAPYKRRRKRKDNSAMNFLSDLVRLGEILTIIGLAICVINLIVLRVQDWLDAAPGSWVRRHDNLDQR